MRSVVATQAQESATLVLRSGDKVQGQLVDMGGVGFTVRVNGQERQIPTNDVSVIDFTGSGDVSDADLNRVSGGAQTVFLRNGQAIDGQLYDIAGTSPLRITLKTSSGERELSSAEIGRIVLSRPATRWRPAAPRLRRRAFPREPASRSLATPRGRRRA